MVRTGDGGWHDGRSGALHQQGHAGLQRLQASIMGAFPFWEHQHGPTLIERIEDRL